MYLSRLESTTSFQQNCLVDQSVDIYLSTRLTTSSPHTQGFPVRIDISQPPLLYDGGGGSGGIIHQSFDILTHQPHQTPTHPSVLPKISHSQRGLGEGRGVGVTA